MKNFLKSSLIICLILLFNSCSSDNEKEGDEILNEEPLSNEPTLTQIGIDVEGLNGIDYTDAVALSSNVEEEININGIFENPYTDNGIEDLPVLITEGEVLLYGYFPHTLKSNKVTIDDILLFYFLIYPQIAIQGPDYNLLLNEIKNYSNYEDLKNVLVNNLNNNQAPILDDSFLNLIREFSTSISPENYSKTTVKSKSNEVVGEFKFNYERSGKIEWQEQTPLYSTMGLVVKDVSKNEIVFGPELLKTKSIQSAVTNWFLNTFVTDLKPATNSFTLTDNGEYEILLTNGHSLNTDLDLAINDKNAKIFASKSLGIVLASGAKTLVSNSECKEALAQYFAQEVNFFVGLDRDSAAYPTNDEWVTHMRSAAGQAFSIVGECSTGIGKKFFKFLGSAIVAFISTPTDIAEIILLEIDYFNSEVAILETRYFENGLSFGKLSTTQISQSNFFEGNEGDSFEFAFLVGEESVKYDVTRTTFSDFIPIDTFSNVEGIPFNIEVTSGDATVQTSPVFSGVPKLEGNLINSITLGCEDSEIVISPAVNFTEIEDYIVTTKTKQEIELGGSFDFGEVNIKATTFPTRQLTIHNPSCNPITVSSISLPDAFNSNWSGGILAPLETKVVTITFNPTKVGNYSGTLTVNNNVDQGNNSFGISGVGTDYIEVTYISHERIEGSPEGFYYATVSIDRGINGALADNVFTRVAVNGGGGGSGAGYDPTNPKSVEFFKDYPVIFSGGGISIPFKLTINGGWGEVMVIVHDPGPPSVSGGVSFRLE